MTPRRDPTTDGLPLRLAYVLAGLLLFVILLTAVPLAWLLFVPLVLLPIGRVLYLLAAIVLPAAITAKGDRSDRPGQTFIAAALGMLVVVSLGAAASLALDRVLDGFSVVQHEAVVPSPSGRLVAVHDYVDQGALGGDSAVFVRGRLVPGVLEWRYRVSVDRYPQDVRWVDERTLSLDGQVTRVPVPIVVLAW